MAAVTVLPAVVSLFQKVVGERLKHVPNGALHNQSSGTFELHLPYFDVLLRQSNLCILSVEAGDVLELPGIAAPVEFDDDGLDARRRQGVEEGRFV